MTDEERKKGILCRKIESYARGRHFAGIAFGENNSKECREEEEIADSIFEEIKKSIKEL